MSKWKIIPMEMPTDGQHVTIRLYNPYSYPLMAVYDATLQLFILDGLGLNYPIYTVFKWQPI